MTITFCTTCNFLTCVCETKRQHRPWCKLRRALTSRVAIECPHDTDVCPMCDPCTCKAAYTPMYHEREFNQHSLAAAGGLLADHLQVSRNPNPPWWPV